jgi:hypothetical protein
VEVIGGVVNPSDLLQGEEQQLELLEGVDMKQIILL